MGRSSIRKSIYAMEIGNLLNKKIFIKQPLFLQEAVFPPPFLIRDLVWEEQ